MKNEFLYTAQYKQDIILYHIYSDVVMKTTQLDELFERQGGVSQIFKKNDIKYLYSITTLRSRDRQTGEVTDTDLPLRGQHISR